MWNGLKKSLNEVLVTLVVTAVIVGVGVWGNSILLDYKFLELKADIIALKAEKVDKSVADIRWQAIQQNLQEVKDNVQFIIRLYIAENPGLAKRVDKKK